MHATFGGNRRGISIKISLDKTKAIAFQGKDPARAKAFVSQKTLEMYLTLIIYGLKFLFTGKTE